jgi:hypothetical protein
VVSLELRELVLWLLGRQGLRPQRVALQELKQPLLRQAEARGQVA